MASQVKRPKLTLKQIEAKAGLILERLLKVIVLEHSELLRRKVKVKNPILVPLVDVRCVSGKKMKALNFEFRKKNQDTDVLSFPSPPVFKAIGVLGDLVVSQAKLELQAKEFGHSVSTELEVLLVHGVLHLLGMDHELGTKEARDMAKWERKILLSLGRKKNRAASLISPSLITRSDR